MSPADIAQLIEDVIADLGNINTSTNPLAFIVPIAEKVATLPTDKMRDFLNETNPETQKKHRASLYPVNYSKIIQAAPNATENESEQAETTVARFEFLHCVLAIAIKKGALLSTQVKQVLRFTSLDGHNNPAPGQLNIFTLYPLLTADLKAAPKLTDSTEARTNFNHALNAYFYIQDIHSAIKAMDEQTVKVLLEDLKTKNPATLFTHFDSLNENIMGLADTHDHDADKIKSAALQNQVNFLSRVAEAITSTVNIDTAEHSAPLDISSIHKKCATCIETLLKTDGLTEAAKQNLTETLEKLNAALPKPIALSTVANISHRAFSPPLKPEPSHHYHWLAAGIAAIGMSGVVAFLIGMFVPTSVGAALGLTAFGLTGVGLSVATGGVFAGIAIGAIALGIGAYYLHKGYVAQNKTLLNQPAFNKKAQSSEVAANDFLRQPFSVIHSNMQPDPDISAAGTTEQSAKDDKDKETTSPAGP